MAVGSILSPSFTHIVSTLRCNQTYIQVRGSQARRKELGQLRTARALHRRVGSPEVRRNPVRGLVYKQAVRERLWEREAVHEQRMNAVAYQYGHEEA